MPRSSPPPKPAVAAAPPAEARKTAVGLGTDLRGAAQLATGAVSGVVDLVESLHQTIASVAGLVGPGKGARTSGITGFVYRSIRGVTKLTAVALDVLLGQVAPLIDSKAGVPATQREAVLAVLNGVFGDRLADTGNPLAITMHMRHRGQALELTRHALIERFPQAGGKLLVLAHGLCMNDLQWLRKGHDHGAALAGDLGCTALYLHYNTGRRVSINGRELADQLQQLVRAWPVAVEELLIVGHSMGGLVTRSACHYGARAGHDWLRCLHRIVFLATPHHGAPLERAGNWADLLLNISPYSAPFARLGMARSAGIRDLRHGALLDEDWQPHHPATRKDTRTPVPLPEGVECVAIAATKQVDRDSGSLARLPGDGLVPVKSALGIHKRAALTLAIPPERQWIGYGMNHFDLLDRPEVYAQLRQRLA